MLRIDNVLLALPCCRNNREDFPVVENLMELQQADEKFLEDANALAESVQSIVHRSEVEAELSALHAR